MTETMPTLSGYYMIEKIYDGPRTLIYKAKRSTDSQPVVIKFLKNEYPSFNELVQFRNQYTIAKNLEMDGILRSYAIENYHNGFALIMEDVGADSLHHYITANPLTLPEFFNVAIAIVKILEGIYKKKVIHKDIKPQNILIHPKTKQVKLIDFSISSLLPRESQEIQSPNVLEGTLAYLSPEQTGRMNRGIDYRTDFYSLGVTFYELLTRQLPFQSDDPMELVHCHIAESPKPPIQINSTIPAVVNDLIMKLMAKTAEERYQSAFGIRYDLEQCQQQWEENGRITSFAIGQRDIADRFQIPEKLYGREAEVATLLAAFDRVGAGNTEMMLVAGFSGIGKTVLVNEVHKPIVRQKGYFIKGKFDQFKRDIPFSALVQAFQTLMRQLLTESIEQVQTWKSNILTALGENTQIIIDVIPELESIIGSQPSVSELEGSAAQNRFHRLFQKFINVFTTAKHPLVIFLDDLQWIDSASLKLIELLMGQTESHYLLLMGAYRDNEVNATHPLILTLEEIRKTDVLVNQITLGPLIQADLNRLIADTLSCPLEKASPLTELVIQKTQGNPFFTNQFLKFLHEEQLIAFDFDCGYWQCDITQVKLLSVSDDVVEFMARQLQKLPVNTQNVLKLAACIGNQFDLAILAIVQEKSLAETAADLWKALQEGLIIPISEVYKFFQASEKAAEATEIQSLSVPYRFLHDRVQQAAYSLIPEEQKPSTHLKIGQLLKSHTVDSELDEKLFDIVNQLNKGMNLISDQSERDELAELNLKAGRKAKASTAYTAASRYLMVALELLPTKSWQNQYDLTLAMYEAAAEAVYLSGDFEQQAQLAEIVLAQARSLLDKVKTYEIQIQVQLAQGQQLKAIEMGLAVLKQLGIDFPEQPSEEDIGLCLQETQLAWEGKPIESLCDLPMMVDKNKQAAMRILSVISSTSFEIGSEFFPLFVCESIQLSINDGNMPESAYGYVTYGVIQIDMGEIDTAYQFGQLAFSVLEKLNAKELKAKVSDFFGGCVGHWKVHFRESLKLLQEGYQSGLEVGDFGAGSNCAFLYCAYSYWNSQELATLEREMANYTEALRQLKQEIALNYNEITRQAVLNLLGQAKNPCFLIGEAYNEEHKLPIHEQTNDIVALFALYLHKIFLSFLFQAYQKTIDYVTIAEEPYVIPLMSVGSVPIIYLCDSLARLAVYPDCSKEEQQSHLDKVQTNQEKMQNWASHAPMNFQHKFDLVEAERFCVLGDNVKAMDYYDRAIAGAKENEYIQEEALANEVAARFYLGWGKDKIAQVYLTEAYYGYARWGAKAKVDDLEKRYPKLLAPILNAEVPAFQRDETRSTITTRTIMATSSLHTHTSSEMLLDFGTVLKASQAISGEIHLETLLVTMMGVVLENAGAEKGVFILRKEGKLVIDALCHGKKDVSKDEVNEVTVLQSIPIEESQEIPLTMINYVSRTQETQVIGNATTEMTFAADPYIIKHQPKSVLCFPILNHGKLVGVLYLENNLATDAFTPHRLKVLNILSSQVAVSLENALLYQTLEEKVVQRTAQLNTKTVQLNAKVEELVQTRHSLVQSEKMASLGRLVAGFAHELNTPIGVAVGTASVLRTKSQLINQLLEQEEVDEEELVAALEKIDEASELTLSNLKRAANLVNSFKRTAVDQTEEKVRRFEVKTSIEDVINTLHNQFRQTAIEIQLDCSDDMKIYSIPGALEQILTNLMMNSFIHGFEEGKNAGQIVIAVRLEGELLLIDYSDTGKGIVPDALEKIFEPFFTTNRARGGSGLGMYICYNLVTSKLNGAMTCESTPSKGVLFRIEFPVALSLPE
jgi:predicted ATPase/signal transduction histidine kinase